jgi:hypothetical protein
MSRRIRLLGVVGTLALLVTLLPAAPARAYLTSCTPDTLVTSYTTAGGNNYTLKGHLCLDIRDGTQPNTLAANTYGHWHCDRNGQDWDGCRARTRLVVEYRNSSGVWTNVAGTAFDIVEPSSGTGYFANSANRVSFSANFADGVVIRAKAEEEDSVRILLADGSTIVANMLDLAGPAATICTIDPC